MASRLIVLRQRLTKAIHAALASFGEIVAEAVARRTEPFLEEGETAFDLALLQRVMGRMIEASFERLVEVDKAHLDELADDVEPRSHRDRRVDAVRGKLIDARRFVQGFFGLERAAEVVAIDGLTARQPELLWRQGEHTASRLRDPDLRLPEARTASVTFDPVELANELDPMVLELRQAIDAVELDRQIAAESRQAKQEVMDEHDQLVSAFGRILSGFYLLAGRPDLAGRIRLSLPRPGRPGSGGGPSSGETSPDPVPGDEQPDIDAEPADLGE